MGRATCWAELAAPNPQGNTPGMLIYNGRVWLHSCCEPGHPYLCHNGRVWLHSWWEPGHPISVPVACHSVDSKQLPTHLTTLLIRANFMYVFRIDTPICVGGNENL